MHNYKGYKDANLACNAAPLERREATQLHACHVFHLHLQLTEFAFRQLSHTSGLSLESCCHDHVQL